MSQNCLVYCRPIELQEYWDFLGEDGQLFYDSRLGLMTFRKGYDFWTLSIKDNIPVPDIKIQIKIDESIISLAYSRDRRYMAIQTAVGTIRIINRQNGKEQKVVLKSWDKMITILLFDFYWKSSSGVDFFIVDVCNVHLYKIDDEKFQIKEIGTEKIESRFAWFEPRSEIIMVANSIGVFQALFLDNYSKTKKIKGPTFTPDLRTDQDPNSYMANSFFQKGGKGVPAFYVNQSLRNVDLNYTSLSEQNVENHRHKIMFVFMYGYPTLIHVNMNLGKVYVHFVTGEKIALFQPSFTVPCESVYSLSLLDNLLVLNNVSDRISLVYDTKKYNPIQTIGSPQPIQVFEPNKAQQEEIVKKEESVPVAAEEKQEDVNPQEEKEQSQEEEEIKPAEENKENFEESKQEVAVEEENKSPSEIKVTGDLTENPKELQNKQIYQQSFHHRDDNPIYFQTTKILENSLLFDSKNKRLYVFEVNSNRVESILEDRVDVLFFFMRRNGCKENALNYLKTIFQCKVGILALSAIFAKFAEIYKKAFEEQNFHLTGQQQQPKNAPISLATSTTNTTISTNHLRTINSYNVIVQSELHSRIFAPLAEDTNFDQDYLIQVLLEYFRISNENNIPILDETQALFFKLILHKKKFVVLQFLLQFHCLRDNYQLAEVLVKLGTKDKTRLKEEKENAFTKYVNDEYFPEMFQLGLDMLWRLGKAVEIVEILLSLGDILDAMELAKKMRFNGINPRWFLDAAIKEGSSCSIEDVISFFLNNVRRAKQEEHFLFEKDVIEIIKNFQKS